MEIMKKVNNNPIWVGSIFIKVERREGEILGACVQRERERERERDFLAV